jgi:hypothetical protein
MSEEDTNKGLCTRSYLLGFTDAKAQQQPSQAVSEDELVELALASGIDCITGLQVRQVIQSLIAAGVIKGA